jgi:hypothetical protein
VSKRKTHSGIFTDEELDALPSLTQEEVAAMPAPWTKRGDMLDVDRRIIRETVDNSEAAPRIFVTGEVTEDYIGTIAVRHLLSINDVYYEDGAGVEPLFVQTRAGTIRMTRFDPRFVWRCFHPDTLVGLVRDEIERLGVDMDPWQMEHMDFYQSMIAAIRHKAGDAIALVNKGGGTDAFYHEVYLSCLLLFGKPGYMDVPVATHFASQEAADFMRDVSVAPLNRVALNRLERLRAAYGSIKALANPEVSFVVDLYEGMLK